MKKQIIYNTLMYLFWFVLASLFMLLLSGFLLDNYRTAALYSKVIGIVGLLYLTVLLAVKPLTRRFICMGLILPVLVFALIVLII
ncbi:MAG: hypothetical protein LC725_12680 [Lentisphaerae bacterium]|nr:hypothetical protein [Lentisphaerota bacterium]